MDIYNIFGIYKAASGEGHESSLPYGMSSEQYDVLRHHFRALWPHQDDLNHESDNARDALTDFTRRVGPWYARGLYGRVHRIPDEHLDVENMPDNFDLYHYSAPNEWHTGKEFDEGKPGEIHPTVPWMSGTHSRGHGKMQFDNHVYGSHPEFEAYPRGYDSSSKYNPAPPLGEESDDPRTELPFRPLKHIVRNVGELVAYHQHGFDPANWPDDTLKTHTPNRTPDEVMNVERYPGEHTAPPPPDNFDTGWWDSQMDKMLRKMFDINKANNEELKFDSAGEQIGGPADEANPQWDAHAQAGGDHSFAMDQGWTGVLPNEDEFHPETGEYGGAGNTAHHVKEWTKGLQEKHGLSLVNDNNEPVDAVYDHHGFDEEPINHTHITDYIKAKTGKTEAFPGAVKGEQFDTGESDEQFEFSLDKMLWKMFDIRKAGNEGYDPWGIEAKYPSIPEGLGTLVSGPIKNLEHASKMGLLHGTPNSLTPHEAAEAAVPIVAKHGVVFYVGDDGHMVSLQQRNDGKSGLDVHHTTHGGRANRALYSSDGTSEARDEMAQQWIDHFKESPHVTHGWQEFPKLPRQSLWDEEPTDEAPMNKMLWKAFGIRKIDYNFRRTSNTGNVEAGITDSYSVATNYGAFKNHFKTPRKAMRFAIKHARNGDTHHAHIMNPQGGVNRVSLHPVTGNLTLHHVTHGDDENKLLNRGEAGVRTMEKKDLRQRDTMALDRMKLLHQNSMLSLGDETMDINTEALYDLPKNLHTTASSQGELGLEIPDMPEIDKMLQKAFGIYKDGPQSPWEGAKTSDDRIMARLGEPQNVGEMQREHKMKFDALNATEKKWPGSRKHEEYMDSLMRYHNRLKETEGALPISEHIGYHKSANLFHGVDQHFPQKGADQDIAGQDYYRPMEYGEFTREFLHGAEHTPRFQGADIDAANAAISELPELHPDSKQTMDTFLEDQYGDFMANTNLHDYYGGINKMFYKMFEIQKDSPVKTLDDYPKHDLFLPDDCTEGFCYENAMHTAMRQNESLNPTVVHGAFPNGNHAWLEYDHPDYGKLVHDPTAGVAGSTKDMYEDPMNQSKLFQAGGIHNGEIITDDHPLLEQPYLKPEVRYTWEEYKDMLRKHKHSGPFHDQAKERNDRHYQGIPHDHTDPKS